MVGSPGKCFQRALNMMGSVLVSLQDKLLFPNHWTKSFNSLLMTDLIVQSSLAGIKKLVSPTKW